MKCGNYLCGLSESSVCKCRCGGVNHGGARMPRLVDVGDEDDGRLLKVARTGGKYTAASRGTKSLVNSMSTGSNLSVSGAVPTLFDEDGGEDESDE